MKSEGVKDIVHWLNQELKHAKLAVVEAEKELADYKKERPLFVEYSDYDERQVELAKERLSELTRIKISAEKYMKKLHHEGK